MGMRALVGTLFFLAFVCPRGVSAMDAGISVFWKTLPLGDLSVSEAKNDLFFKEGPVDFELKQPRLEVEVGGFEIGNGKLIFRTGKFELRFKEVIGKNIFIADLPKITFRSVQKEKIILGKRVVYSEPVAETTIEKTRKETVLFTMKDVALIAEKKADVELGLFLPAEIPMALSQNTLALTDANAFITALQASIDDSFSDTALEAAMTFRLENVPATVESLARGQKPALYAALRDALKKEVQKPTFVKKLETELTQQLPVLEEPGSYGARVTFRPDTNGYSNVTIGSMSVETSSNTADLISVTNTEGLNLLVRSLFSGIAQGKIHTPWPGRLSYTPAAKDAVQLADIVAQMSGVTVEASNVVSLAIDLVAPEVKLSEKDIDLKVNLSLTLKSGDPVRFPVHFQFTVDAENALVLNRIQAEPTGKSLRGTGFPLFRALQTEVKLKIATLLLNEQLAHLQKGEVGSTKTTFELIAGADPALRISAKR